VSADEKTTLKTLHCIGGLEIGGAETALYRTVTRFRRQRFTSVVISLMNIGPIGERLQSAGVSLIALGKRRGVPDARIVLKLARIFKMERPHLIHSNMYEANVYGLVAARLVGIPVVWSIRTADIDYNYYRAWSEIAFRTNRLLSRFPDAILFNSDAGYHYHRAHGFNNARMLVIPYGFDTELFHPNLDARHSVRAELDVPPDAFLIGRFARMDAMKDYPTFIAGAARILREHPTVYFICTGRDVNRKNGMLTQLLDAHNVSDRFVLLGHRDDMPRLMASVDFTVSSSMTEGFPNVVGEAMACGVPNIVTDVGDSAQLIDDARWVAPRKNPAALAEVMEQMLRLSTDERRAIGARARQRIVEQYDIAQTTRRLEEFYEQLLTKKKV